MCPSFPEIENPACLRPGLLGQDTRVVTSDAGYILTATLHFLQHADPHQISPLRQSLNSAGRKSVRVNACQCSPLAESGTADFVATRPLLSRSPGVPVDRRSLQDKPANLRRRYPVSHRPEQSGDRALDKIDESLTGANTPKAHMANIGPVVGMGCAMDTRN